MKCSIICVMRMAHYWGAGPPSRAPRIAAPRRFPGHLRDMRALYERHLTKRVGCGRLPNGAKAPASGADAPCEAWPSRCRQWRLADLDRLPRRFAPAVAEIPTSLEVSP